MKSSFLLHKMELEKGRTRRARTITRSIPSASFQCAMKTRTPQCSGHSKKFVLLAVTFASIQREAHKYRQSSVAFLSSSLGRSKRERNEPVCGSALH